MSLTTFMHVKKERTFTRLVFTGPGGTVSLGGLGGGDDPFLLLTPDEVKELIQELETALDPSQRVLVKVSGHSYQYTYCDPTGTLTVGDAVLVPFGFQNDLAYGEVVALGDTRFPGPVKDVAEKIVTTEVLA